MRARPGKLVFALFLPAFAACSLFVSLDDLQGGGDGTAPDGGADAPVTNDGAPTDGGSDAISPADASFDASVFLDDFDRPDDAAIGNGWIEKNPASYSIVNDTAARTSERTTDFADNIFYRPASEDVADTEVSVEFAFSGTDAGGYPQVHARVQSDTVAQSDKLDSYLLYVEDEFVAQLSRERDSEILTDLQTLSLTQTLTVGPTYRLRMRVVGAHPVQVTGYVEVKNAAGWSTIGFASTVDDDVTQLADAGSVGMSASNGDVSFAYDNFSRTNL